MREYVFILEYDRGVHPVRDAFIDNPEVVATTLDISTSLEGGWRVERLTGPEHALDAIETAYLSDQCNDCTYPTPACDAAFEYQILESEPTSKTIYRYVTDQTHCHAVSYLALKTLGEGVVFDAIQRGRYYEWRLLVPTETNINRLHDVLRQDLPDGISLDVRRIGSPERWARGQRPQYGTELPYEQREAVETAMSMGYYDHPREAELRDIAAELEIPLTTLQYRLRRGEAWATTTALGGVQLATAGSIEEAGE
jgi:predicted DNA binding protein